MLQQILRDMWVDPEILAELDETQKQTLFCKMREEQVRRWQIWDQKVSKEDDQPKFQKNAKKQVQFLKGEDGEPWVWVMGDHPDDKSIESILAEEAQKRALQQARVEAQHLRQSVEKELTQLIEYEPLDALEQKFDLCPKNIDPLEDSLEIYCSVDDLRQRIEALDTDVSISENDDIKLTEKSEYTDKQLKNTLHFNFIEGKRDVIQEVCVGEAGSGVSSRVAAWERRVAAARASDILRGLRARRARTLRDAALHARHGDRAWREQERKAKEAEAAMREIARAAREAHRRTTQTPVADVPDSPVDPTLDDKPSSKEDVLEWFQNTELKRGVGLDENNKPVDWFHGLISRAEAEQALREYGADSFLVRLSARGEYALAVRHAARTAHHRLHAAPAYRLHAAPRRHHSLADLINYHKTVPITEVGGELLLESCPPAAPPACLFTS